MNLDLIEKHIHLTELPSGAEVSFGGQPCLTVENYGEAYLWKINPFFAKMSYGANVFLDIPHCVEGRDSLEEAIAAGLTTLYDLGAFSGVVDIPEDSYVEAHLDESGPIDPDSVSKMLSQPGLTDKNRKLILQRLSASSQKYSDKKLKEDLDEGWKAKVGAITTAAAIAAIPVGINIANKGSAGKYVEPTTASQRQTVKPINFSNNPYSNGTVPDLNDPKNNRSKLKNLNDDVVKDFNRIVYDSVLADCRAEAMIHCDTLMEAHQFANDLYGSFISELSDAKYSYVAKNAALRAADGYGKLSKEKAGTKQSDAIVKDIIHDEDSSFAAKKKLEKHKAEKKNESVSEAIKDSDAYWKDFDARQKEAAAKKERARAGIAEPVKKGQGRPTSIDREDLKDRAKENIKNGKRPSHGFDRNEKLTYVRHLLNHPDHPEFAEAHVAKAGRTVGTTKAAKAEKEKSAEQEKATTRATAGWMAGLGAR